MSFIKLPLMHQEVGDCLRFRAEAVEVIEPLVGSNNHCRIHMDNGSTHWIGLPPDGVEAAIDEATRKKIYHTGPR